ncbi:MAG: DUF1338 domain-containing protein [Bacteroidales bacterium]|jgi:hypothetical protein|nr:DUF1338 domain-containing protein [Bacteroidales bacterium]HOO66673.1 DUF1338 domain-containing protein [Bacteroidales bacterium]HPE22887.1 DUF1338 domain-containing protein [Bacteroidales bacterium]HPJ05444.1 DUF1338 domain-containing protein [Bacteroidales bacterium]HPQ64327.1 DUF1338 domain-containing protein [Bacteroidales bacterium]
METAMIFQRFWNRFSTENPHAKRIFDLFTARGEKVMHDHIAIRTFDDPRMNIDVISRVFTKNGYEARGNYEFKAKKLRGKHFEHNSDPDAPKVFVSELLTDQFSDYLQTTVRECLNRPGDSIYADDEMVYGGSIWGRISFETYNRLRQESEYAAWLLVYGYRANHFAVKVNELKQFETLQQVNAFIKSNGYLMTTVGGEIYGTPEELLEQSATMAEIQPVEFTDGIYEIPSCFYEFTLRYNQPDGKQYSGFIAANADKIFESTDYYNRQADKM